MLSPKWCTRPDKTPTSCFNAILRRHIRNLRRWRHKSRQSRIGDQLPHAVKYPKILFTQSSIMLTPKWSAQSGDQPPHAAEYRGFNSNLYPWTHMALSLPGV
jgi:hypothetical protein